MENSQYWWEQWEWAKDEAPAPRYYHTSVVLGTDLYVFGGTTGSSVASRFSKMHALDLKTMQWREIQSSGPNPYNRSSASACAIGPDKFLVFGGYPYHQGNSNNILIFHAASSTWTSHDGDGVAPPRRANCCPAYERGVVFFVSGALQYLRLDHLRAGLPRMRWHDVPCLSRSALQTASHDAAVYVPGPDVLVSVSNYSLTQAVSVFDFADAKWKALPCPPHNPYPIHSHAMSALGDYVLLYGGYTKEGRSQATWVLDTRRWVWRELAKTSEGRGEAGQTTVLGKIAPYRWGHSLHHAGDGMFVVFGGYDGQSFANDVWIFRSGTAGRAGEQEGR